MDLPAEQVVTTSADGLRAMYVGTITFEHIRRYVAGGSAIPYHPRLYRPRGSRFMREVLLEVSNGTGWQRLGGVSEVEPGGSSTPWRPTTRSCTSAVEPCSEN